MRSLRTLLSRNWTLVILLLWGLGGDADLIVRSRPDEQALHWTGVALIAATAGLLLYRMVQNRRRCRAAAVIRG